LVFRPGSVVASDLPRHAGPVDGKGRAHLRGGRAPDDRRGLVPGRPEPLDGGASARREAAGAGIVAPPAPEAGRVREPRTRDGLVRRRPRGHADPRPPPPERPALGPG